MHADQSTERRLPTELSARMEVGSEHSLLTDDWIAAARDLLVREGADSVKIDRIAKACGVSRGGFYWRFRNRAALLKCLIDDWAKMNLDIIDEFHLHDGTEDDRLKLLAKLWRGEDFHADYDLSVRSWATHYDPAKAAVHMIDSRYLTALRASFTHLNFPPADAAFRANILYNQHIGACSSMTIGSAATLDSTAELLDFLLPS
ncbi:MAG: TetR/AcrR family transcriptional regulator [Sphingobium sp.]